MNRTGSAIQRIRILSVMNKLCTVTLLTSKDLGEAFHLSTQAGWNQTEADWVRLLELNPETCFLFHHNNKVVGSATLATYDSELAWIGMIIVDIDFRGMGIGKQALETVIHESRKRGFKCTGLDATDQGRLLYKKYGFYDVHPIDRWSGSLQSLQHHDAAHLLEHKHLNELLQLDFRWRGLDRSGLIRRFFSEETVQGIGLTRNRALRGFAFLRPGRQYQHLGPLAAETIEDFADLLNATARILNDKPVYIDALRRQESADLLTRHGLRVERRLTRMTLDEPCSVLDTPEIHAAAAFEWG